MTTGYMGVTSIVFFTSFPFAIFKAVIFYLMVQVRNFCQKRTVNNVGGSGSCQTYRP